MTRDYVTKFVINPLNHGYDHQIRGVGGLHQLARYAGVPGVDALGSQFGRSLSSRSG